MLRIANLNVNSLRAARRRGLEDWLVDRSPDILCLQEIRARPEKLGDWADGPAGWHAYWRPAERPGYAGVALLSKQEPLEIDGKFGDEKFDSEGRWLLARYPSFSVVSLYLHSGAHRRAFKHDCMDLLYERLRKMAASGEQFVVCCDLNIAHTRKDVKIWGNNFRNKGYQPLERAWLDRVIDELGWIDVFRKIDQSAGQYSWWSRRGEARKNKVGRRIDYQLATPSMARLAQAASIDTERVLSDHSPMVIDYRTTLNARPK